MVQNCIYYNKNERFLYEEIPLFQGGNVTIILLILCQFLCK